VLEDRAARIRECVATLERLGLAAQQGVCEQVAILRGSFEDMVAKARIAAVDIDAAHQQVYTLQQLTETELRGQLSLDVEEGPPRESHAALQRNVQELEGCLKALQEELSATLLLRREAAEEAQRHRDRADRLGETVRALEDGRAAARRAQQDLEARLAAAAAEAADCPYTVGLTLDCDYDAVARDGAGRAALESRLRNDISLALGMPKAAVQVGEPPGSNHKHKINLQNNHLKIRDIFVEYTRSACPRPPSRWVRPSANCP
jgi:chromosome segregation ATPase